MSSKILIVEDDALLCSTLCDLLEDDGYILDSACNGEVALELTYQKRFDLYILDINIPLINGIDLLKELRLANDETAALFLTSHNDKETLKSAFLNGCDDYITKPFDTDELLLRVEAILKRSSPQKMLEYGDLKLNERCQRVIFQDSELDLSAKEYQLLSLLLTYAETTVSKDMIQEHLWSYSQSSSDGAIRVYINRIKQLIENTGITIENIRGVGYKLVKKPKN